MYFMTMTEPMNAYAVQIDAKIKRQIQSVLDSIKNSVENPPLNSNMKTVIKVTPLINS